MHDRPRNQTTDVVDNHVTSVRTPPAMLVFLATCRVVILADNRVSLIPRARSNTALLIAGPYHSGRFPDRNFRHQSEQPYYPDALIAVSRVKGAEGAERFRIAR
jgi:hypothetical protein